MVRRRLRRGAHPLIMSKPWTPASRSVTAAAVYTSARSRRLMYKRSSRHTRTLLDRGILPLPCLCCDSGRRAADTIIAQLSTQAFSAWIHVCAVRLFVESILRYGLPPRFLAALMKPTQKTVPKLRKTMASTFGEGANPTLTLTLTLTFTLSVTLTLDE